MYFVKIYLSIKIKYKPVYVFEIEIQWKWNSITTATTSKLSKQFNIYGVGYGFNTEITSR